MLFLAFSALLLNFHSVLQNFPPHCTTAPLSLLNMFQNISIFQIFRPKPTTFPYNLQVLNLC